MHFSLLNQDKLITEINVENLGNTHKLETSN
jgi:hypothetical protein